MLRCRAIVLPLAVALMVAGCGSSSHNSSATSTSATNAGTPGPEGIPLEQGPALATPTTTATSGTIDGIQCAPLEQLAYHIHAHLQVYVDGQPRSLPAGIGLILPVGQQTARGPFYGASQCYWWLHTHASDGIVHIESPTTHIYTLGNFFDEWRQPLTRDQVGPAKGTLSIFVNGKRFTGSPREIPLQPHAVIQIDVGSPVVPFQNVSFAGTQL